MVPLAPSGGYKIEKDAREEMNRFLHDFDPRSDGLPKRIEPGVVERFLREELQRGRPTAKVAAQAAELADFYQIRNIIPEMLKWLDRQERSTEDFLRSIALVRAVGVLGTDSQRREGLKYYLHLLSLPQAQASMAELMQCYLLYVSPEASRATRERIDELLKVLEAKELVDPAAGTAMRQLGDLRGVTIPRIEAAVAMQSEIMEMGDVSSRLDRLVDIYLGIDLRYREYSERWAVRMLQREARSAGNDAVIAAFRRARVRLNKEPSLADGAQARSAMLVHAIEFFGGKPSVDEAAFMQPKAKRFDLLSVEP